jgi:lysophospholipase L1-like esterase
VSYSGERKIAVALGLVAAAILAVQVLAWRSFLVHRSNVIGRNPAWTVMKQEVVYHPSAYEDFVQEPVGREGVNLWRGQGYQGLRWRNPRGVEITRVRTIAGFDLPGSYLYVLFRVQEQGAYALRLSTHPAHPSGFCVFAADWQMRGFQPVASPSGLAGRTVEVELHLEGPEFTAYLDGRPIGSFRDERWSDGTVALKGSLLPVRVAQVGIEGRERGNGRPAVWSEDFQHGSSRGLAGIALLIALPLLALGAGLAAAYRHAATRQALRLLSAGILILMASLAFLLLQPQSLGFHSGLVSLLILFLGGAALFGALDRRQQASPGARPRPAVRAALASAGAAALMAAGLFVLPAGRLPPLFAASPDETRGWSKIADARLAKLRIGEPVSLASHPMGDQELRLRTRLEPGTLLEVRFWEPRFEAGPEYRCSARWHALLLSTVPEIPGGFYLYDAELSELGRLPPAVPLAGRWLDLRLTIEGDRLRAFAGDRLVAEARASSRDIGASSVYLFAGDATLSAGAVKGPPPGSPSPPLPDSWVWAGLAALAAVVVLGYGARYGLRRAAAYSLLGFLFSGAFLSLEFLLQSLVTLRAHESRVLIWAAFWSQAIVVLQFALAGAPRVWRGIAALALTAGSLLWAAFGNWSNPYRVVQLELQAEVPPTPYRWLWYRHPSFRACNGFLQSQRFGPRRAAVRKPEGRTRVLCLGASQTLGFGASTLQHAYPQQLEDLLNRTEPRYEVLNAGVPGSYTLTSRSYLQGLLAKFQPDVAVIDFCAADYVYLSMLYHNGLDPNQRLAEIERSGFHQAPAGRLLSNLRFWVGFQRSKSGRPPDDAWIRRRYEQNLGDLVKAARQAGTRVFVLLEPKTLEVNHPSIDYPRLYDTARRVAARHGAVVVDPTEAVVWAEQSGVVWWDYAHMTDFGYRVLAAEVARAIRRDASGGGSSTSGLAP